MYGSLEGVSALVPSVGVFDAITTPSDAQVSVWLQEASTLIDSTLATVGYNTTVASTAAIAPVLSAMAQLYAAATVLQARGLDSVTGENENKSEKMFKRFYGQLHLLSDSHLEELGVTVKITSRARRRRLRTVQTRRIDGYSATYEGRARTYLYPSD